jgi:hypothetical protein
VRDARITTIYEGTTGIQALDLLGRKIMQQRGEGLRLFLEHLAAFCAQHANDAATKDFIPKLSALAREWAETTQKVGLRAASNPDEIGAAAVDYLFYSGYIAEQGMEQYARDARITTIYEGTTGIQALALLGRKIVQQRGEGLRLFLEQVGAFCAQHAKDPALQAFIPKLSTLAHEWTEVTQTLGQRAVANPDEIGAASVDYLLYSGYVALAYTWARSVATADASSQSDAFKQAKRLTARFYFDRILPRTRSHLAAMQSDADSVLAMPDALFG